MGWTSYHREKDAESNREHFAAMFDKHYEIIADGTVDSVFYAAVCDHRTGEVSAFIALIRWTQGADNFAYKGFGEASLPFYYKAPAKVLDALTPTTNEYALEWRAACRLHHEQHAFLRKLLKPGTKIRLRDPLTFNNDLALNTFTYTGHSYLTHDSFRYRVPRWRDSVAAIVNDDDSEILTPVGHRQAAAVSAREGTPGPSATSDKQQPSA